jgi:hypothetical protein
MDTKEVRANKIARFKYLNRQSEVNDESLFHSEYIMKNCDNFHIIHDEPSLDVYYTYFQWLYKTRMKYYPNAFVINFDLLVDFPEKLVGQAIVGKTRMYYMQLTCKIHLQFSIIPITDEYYDLDSNERIMAGQFIYGDYENFISYFDEFKKTYVIDMPSVKSIVANNGKSGGGGFFM